MNNKLLPDAQLFLRAGIVEFGWGHPNNGLLPHAGLAHAAAHTFEQNSAAALAYGPEQGPGRLISQLATWLGRSEGVSPALDRILITGGNSQALDLLCTLLTQPGDRLLVEAPTYHLALRIFRDHQLTLVPVASDEQGLRPDALEAALRLTPARLLYLVPTFNNPSGATLPLDRRYALLAIAQHYGVTILEDDVYRELWYDTPPPPALGQLDTSESVIRLCSFAKLVAPGLRLGWIVAPPSIVRRWVGCGVIDSGGGVNHLTAHIVANFLALGLFDSHLSTLREALGQRRDQLDAALQHALPAPCHWQRPGGGFFVWINLPADRNSDTLLESAEAAGVSFLPGNRFYANHRGGERYLRLAFALLSAAEMVEGARRLAEVVMRG